MPEIDYYRLFICLMFFVGLYLIVRDIIIAVREVKREVAFNKRLEYIENNVETIENNVETLITEIHSEQWLEARLEELRACKQKGGV